MFRLLNRELIPQILLLLSPNNPKLNKPKNPENLCRFCWFFGWERHTSTIQGVFLSQFRLGQVRLGWVRLGWVRLGWVRLAWVRLAWVRLGTTVLMIAHIASFIQPLRLSLLDSFITYAWLVFLSVSIATAIYTTYTIFLYFQSELTQTFPYVLIELHS